jgi:D-alanyl-D-alanine carboxypeptidase/D-alanyl-D-alanine-endopeptidase (penicillin-binding protein 4)
LSRYNLITPTALVDVLAHVYGQDRLRDSFLDTLPLAGVDGTLQGRFVGTAAAGNVRAKTGSFTNARALAGYVWTKDGEPLAFTIIANNYNTANVYVGNVIERIVVLLAEFSRNPV